MVAHSPLYHHFYLDFPIFDIVIKISIAYNDQVSTYVQIIEKYSKTMSSKVVISLISKILKHKCLLFILLYFNVISKN